MAPGAPVTSGRDLDEVELAYEQAITCAAGRGDNDRAYELSVYLEQYRSVYKSGPVKPLVKPGVNSPSWWTQELGNNFRKSKKRGYLDELNDEDGG